LLWSIAAFGIVQVLRGAFWPKTAVTTFDIHLAEITERTEALVGRCVAPDMKGQEIHRLHIPVPMVRRAAKKGYAFVSDSPRENLEIWDYIWHQSACYEVVSQALYFYQHRNLSRAEANTIRNWVERCACWEHSDDLSKIYATVVEINPGWIVPTLKKWNRSNNLWKRRQSMVSLIEYASRRKRFLSFQELIAFIEPLLDDNEYYVQKGLGWTLREIYNAYPQETARFIQRNVLRIAPLAWSAATQKLGKADKAQLSAARKNRSRAPGSSNERA
jgi:3-methyladenine DNA glycosylase AlkD